MREIMLLSFFWLSFAVSAKEEFDPVTDVVGDGVLAGSHLSYNCESKRFECHLEKPNCTEAKTCFYLEKSQTKQSCFQKQLYFASRAMSVVECDLVNIN